MSKANETFLNEIKDYSIKDLELIRDTQKDLYTAEEMKVICDVIEEKTYHLIQERLPKEIKCPKCDGPNLFEKDVCQYCGCKIDKRKYFDINYMSEEENEEETQVENDKQDGYGFQYVISFLIPLIGYILGAILLSREDEESRSHGKVCIILGITSVLIYVIIVYNFIF
jgi:hypothetical protein